MTKTTNYLGALLIGAAFMLTGLTPLTAEAASKKPTCELTVSTEQGETDITKDGDVMLLKGEEMEIEWSSKNAETATLDGKKIDLKGSDDVSPTKETTYEFVFENGSKEASCEVTVHVVEGSIAEIDEGSRKPAISGEKVTGTKKVGIAIYKEGGKKPVFEKKNISVKRGEWLAKVNKNLPEGEYEIRLYGDKKLELNLIATAELVVDKDGSESEGSKKANDTKKEDKVKDTTKKSNGILQVSMVPLGIGGSASANANISAALVEVRNTGTESVQVTGFNVRQTGTASTNTIVELSTKDEKGVSSATAKASWKNGMATAPASATVAPGTSKYFTVKALLGANATMGTSIVLDIVGINSNAKSATGMFPIRGTIFNVI